MRALKEKLVKVRIIKVVATVYVSYKCIMVSTYIPYSITSVRHIIIWIYAVVFYCPYICRASFRGTKGGTCPLDKLPPP